jgi:hypothetical protein
MNEASPQRNLLVYLIGLVALLAVALASNLIYAEDQGLEPQPVYPAHQAKVGHVQNQADTQAAEQEEQIGEAWLDLAKAEASKDLAAIEAAKARLAALAVPIASTR